MGYKECPKCMKDLVVKPKTQKEYDNTKYCQFCGGLLREIF